MTYEELYDNLKLYHGYLINDIAECELVFDNVLFITLKDGSNMTYDNISKAVRNIPCDKNNMTEQECRNEFGYRLRRMMCIKGITQSDISQKTGISQAQLSSYINGRHTPSFYVVDKISKALDCSIDEFSYR